MVHAFVMVRTGAGKSEHVRGVVEDFDNVQEAHVVAGQYDVIAEVDAPEVHEVIHTSSGDIQQLDGVERTKTYISLS